MALRDVLGRLVVEDGLGRLNYHEQLAPSEQEQVPRSRAAPGVPARALATLASVSLRLPRALATRVPAPASRPRHADGPGASFLDCLWDLCASCLCLLQPQLLGPLLRLKLWLSEARQMQTKDKKNIVSCSLK